MYRTISCYEGIQGIDKSSQLAFQHVENPLQNMWKNGYVASGEQFLVTRVKIRVPSWLFNRLKILCKTCGKTGMSLVGNNFLL